jgi:lipopolysaccharide/colanic/teichoic acid biosynthesis glycosyltransferase
MFFFFLQLCILILAFALASVLKTGGIIPAQGMAPALICLLLTWLFSVLVTRKYQLKLYQIKPRYVLASVVHGDIVLIVLTMLSTFFVLEAPVFIPLTWYTVALYCITELFLFLVIVIVKVKTKSTTAIAGEIKKYAQHDLVITRADLVPDLSQFTGDKLKLIAPQALKQFFKGEAQPAQEVKVVLHGNEKPESLYDVIILDKRLNDLQDINSELEKIYSGLNNGGYLLVPYTELGTFENNYLYSGLKPFQFFRKIHYYLYHRAMPKIPYINLLYKAISGGKNKVISKAEAWGRLCYSGFDVDEELLTGNITLIKARKTFTRSENPNPSFSPVITLNRVSLGGHIIKIHKVRSMYPYSEFLQKKVFEMSNLSSTGKFNNDFRITVFGKLFRKYWIDELPQLADWLSGEIKLVGIRAMSQHYFSLYTKEYQELYFKVKPGIFSPIFDEKTASFEDIQRIEQEYLESYIKQPLMTDVRYFFKTISHILKGVRSK